MSVIVNGCPLGDSEASRGIRDLFVDSQLWLDLCYQKHNGFDDESEDAHWKLDKSNSSEPEDEIFKLGLNEKSCEVGLRCQVFDSISTELSSETDVGYFQELSIEFQVSTPSFRIHFNFIMENLQYALSSLILNLEFKFPFVFSYYGRHLVQLNYQNLTTTLSALRRTNCQESTTKILEVKLEPPEPKKESPEMKEEEPVPIIALKKLKRAILTEYNTLNVMKECDLNHHRSKLCRQFVNKLIEDDSKRSIKCKAYRATVFKPGYSD